MTTPDGLPIETFASAKQWEGWLAKHHKTSPGIWLRVYKKGSDTPSVDYLQALESALCYGWIDGQKRAYDAASWIQRFTPRRPKSPWSKINTERATQLMASGRMKAAGRHEVEAAQADGRWDASYDSSKTMTFPDDFLTALQKNKKAKAFFDTLNRTNLYAIAYRLQTAKTDATRARRMTAIFDKLEKGERWH